MRSFFGKKNSVFVITILKISKSPNLHTILLRKHGLFLKKKLKVIPHPILRSFTGKMWSFFTKTMKTSKSLDIEIIFIKKMKFS